MAVDVPDDVRLGMYIAAVEQDPDYDAEFDFDAGRFKNRPPKKKA